jgi:Ser/Thr protein kinase RdoA (MazF antagonist)
MPFPEMTHSIASAPSIAELAVDRWNIGSIARAALIRSYVNDLYRVETDGGVYALKVFRRSWRNRWDAGWEAQLCSHLNAKGISLAMPIPGRDEEHVQILMYPEGDRAALLTPWLDGTKPRPPWTERIYRDFGRAAARMHQASISFVPETPGRLLNVDHLIRRPIAKLRDPFSNRPELYRRLLDGGERIASEIDLLVPQLAFGVCQGDLSFDNLHFLRDGSIAFYDFDLGGHGWFCFDFAFFPAWMKKEPDAIRWWNAFRSGYGEVREITTAEVEALPLFDIAYKIWDLEHTIHNWAVWTGTWQATDQKIEAMLDAIFEHDAFA